MKRNKIHKQTHKTNNLQKKWYSNLSRANKKEKKKKVVVYLLVLAVTDGSHAFMRSKQSAYMHIQIYRGLSSLNFTHNTFLTHEFKKINTSNEYLNKWR